MSIQSEQLKNDIAAFYGSHMSGSLLYLFSGTPPTSAEAAIDPNVNTLIVTVSDNDSGGDLNYDTSAAAGTVQKDPNQVWSGTVLNSGIPTFFRLCKQPDNGISYTPSAARLQGTVGMGGADLNVSRTTFINGENFLINFASNSQRDVR